MLWELLIVSLAASLVKGLALLVSYINNNAFPQPLSEQEEAYYLSRLGQGDEARNKLIEHNLRLVAHITNEI